MFFVNDEKANFKITFSNGKNFTMKNCYIDDVLLWVNDLGYLFDNSESVVIIENLDNGEKLEITRKEEEVWVDEV